MMGEKEKRGGVYRRFFISRFAAFRLGSEIGEDAVVAALEVLAGGRSGGVEGWDFGYSSRHWESVGMVSSGSGGLLLLLLLLFGLSRGRIWISAHESLSVIATIFGVRGFAIVECVG